MKKITFGPQKNWYRDGEFGRMQVPHIKALIKHLKSNPENHPLNTVKKIEFREIIKDSLGGFNTTQAREINKLFLESIGHKNLETIKINAYHNGSILTGTEIQPVINNSPNLKTFVFNGFQSDKTVSLSFEGKTHLSKVKLHHWKGTATPLTHLKTVKSSKS